MKRLAHLREAVPDAGPRLTIALHSACAEPESLTRQLGDLRPLNGPHRVFTLMPMGQAPYVNGAGDGLEIHTFFPGPGMRKAFAAKRLMPWRLPLSKVPGVFASGAVLADVAVLQVSPPDGNGFVSLGISVDYIRAVLAQRPVVVAAVNPNMPRTFGDTLLHVSDIDWYLDDDAPILESAQAKGGAVDDAIAHRVAALVEDGMVIQVGIGSLPDLVLARLGHLRHLGVHSGVITDSLVPLIESGVIDNSTKRMFRGITTTAMACGTRPLYSFLHRNPSVEFHPSSLIHSRESLASLDRFCAINSGLQVDLDGNVNAETADGRPISMPGGLPDFAAGAASSHTGRSIVALRSTFGTALSSNIVPTFGTEPTVPAAHVDFVVTEWGVAALRGLSPERRADALVQVAHPDHRERLEMSLRRRVPAD